MYQKIYTKVSSCRGRVTVGAVGAAAPTVFCESLFCSNKTPFRHTKFKGLHTKFMDFDSLHPQHWFPYAAPVWTILGKQRIIIFHLSFLENCFKMKTKFEMFLSFMKSQIWKKQKICNQLWWLSVSSDTGSNKQGNI